MEVALTPEPDTENPIRIQPGRPLSFTNGVLKRHHHHQPPAPVTYKECLKNHAASMGGHALDGCGEFMPSPASLKCAGTDPTSLTCAACGCHRNFHRRETEEIHPAAGSAVQHVIEFQPYHRHHPLPPPHSSSSPESPSPPPISSSYYPSAPHMLLALSAGPPADPNPPTPAGAGAPSSGIPSSGNSFRTKFTQNQKDPNPPTPAGAFAGAPSTGNPSSRKRFRTKFTQTQKEKMQEFAEKIQWKIQRSDDAVIKDFCSEIGVERRVLKVWMHNNNKSNLGKKDANSNGGEINHLKLSQNLNNNEISSDPVVNTNGSSSS